VKAQKKEHFNNLFIGERAKRLLMRSESSENRVLQQPFHRKKSKKVVHEK